MVAFTVLRAPFSSNLEADRQIRNYKNKKPELLLATNKVVQTIFGINTISY